MDEIGAAGFVNLHHELTHWLSRLDPAAVRALYATFSSITRLPEAEQSRLLEFGGVVERTFVTTVTWASGRELPSRMRP